MFKKLLIAVVILAVIGVIASGNKGTAPASSNVPPVAPKILTIQDVASQNNLSIGQLDKVYRLDLKYKNSDGSYMVINFQSVKAMKQFKDFNNIIYIDNVLPLKETREMFDKTGFFVVYDENGKDSSDVNVTTGRSDSGGTGIVLYNDKVDLTKCKYLSFGPVDGASSQQILFQIQ
ncbi:hypothetical protein [Desulfosporosinus sp. OT]|uniref:hypothetical protein n=1 Tax=Desulfosporosinus sp. OT TaxID=913865 RepID=UPI000223A90D|nr:hypothetical protein [Desulfosporosinus sp. OT]EGW39071.1 hypothetical protein DOT_3022 [Desulfosporosinus sp. OT]